MSRLHTQVYGESLQACANQAACPECVAGDCADEWAIGTTLAWADDDEEEDLAGEEE